MSVIKSISGSGGDPRAYIVADNATEGNRLLQFYSMSVFTNTRAYQLNITGQYEAV